MQKNIKIHYSLKKRKCLPKPESISHLRITLKDLSEGFCVIKHLCKSFMPVPQLSTHPNFTIGMKDQCVHLGTVFESLSTCRESKSNKSEATNFTRNKTKTHPAVSWHPWRKLPEVKSCSWKLENWGRDSARELLGDNYRAVTPESCHAVAWLQPSQPRALLEADPRAVLPGQRFCPKPALVIITNR